MKFEAFYKEAYDAEMEELFSDHASETENKPSKDSCDLLMKKARSGVFSVQVSEKVKNVMIICWEIFIQKLPRLQDAGRKSDIRH